MFGYARCLHVGMRSRSLFMTLVGTVVALTAMGCADPTEEDEDGVDSSEDMLASVGPEPVGRPSRHAIVLAHGFDAHSARARSMCLASSFARSATPR